jgi:hypothetical protein
MRALSKHDWNLHAWARHLRVLAPPVWPVRVRCLRLPEDTEGDCLLCVPKGKSPYYAIRVNSRLSPDTQVYVLLHEWAHALSWGSDSHRIRAHGAEWGIAMSRIWQALLED